VRGVVPTGLGRKDLRNSRNVVAKASEVWSDKNLLFFRSLWALPSKRWRAVAQFHQDVQPRRSCIVHHHV